jgi:hypothetical protein
MIFADRRALRASQMTLSLFAGLAAAMLQLTATGADVTSRPKTVAQAPTEPAKDGAMRKPGQVDWWSDEYEATGRLKSLNEDEANEVAAHHLASIASALHAYIDANNGELPPSAVSNNKIPPEKRLSGLVLLLPYFESRPTYYKTDDDPNWLKRRLDPTQAALAAQLFKSIDLTKAWDDPVNLKAAKTMVPVFLAPGIGPYRDTHGFAVSNFAFVRGYAGEENGAFPEQGGISVYDPSGTKDSVSDGTAVTLGIGQVAADLGPWIAAGSSSSRYLADPASPDFGSRYGKAALFANCDASVFFLDVKATNPSLLKAMTTRAGGEIVDGLKTRYKSVKEWKKATQPPAK